MQSKGTENKIKADTPSSLASWDEEEKLIARYIVQHSANQPVTILEAGCGNKWDQGDLLSDVNYILTGVDLDEAALERRKNVQKDLDEAIHGDLRQVEFESESFDVVFSSYVLEHISDTDRVMSKFVKWLKPGGLIILRIPDPGTVYGFASKVLPFWVHILYAKYIVGDENPGKDGNGPYPVVYEAVVSRAGISEFARTHELLIREELCDGYLHVTKRHPYPLISKVSKLISGLSLGALKSHRNLLFVLQKPEININPG